ncbi:hypothetical protein [Granulicella sp. S156]|uniref:hypothetical protein n=1 Tax=Granulicella sp. S156 TaxID=1747224 RepID=UPI00131E6986|nr:hypothetical protein [Granulicella sp. S156]
MKLIADTNVWYDIGNGIIDPLQFSEAETGLFATPISLLEIASGIDDHALDERKRAADAVIRYCTGVTDDTETHLAKLWEAAVNSESLPWIDGFRAIAGASTQQELESGVDDIASRTRRTVKVGLVHDWREEHWRGFQTDVIDALNDQIPGYADARAQGRFVRLAKEARVPFRDAMRSREIKVMTMMATYERTRWLHNGPISPASEVASRLEILLAPYIGAYGEYIIRCATEMAPQANDFGDFESFAYLQPGTVLVTRDKRWVKIAKAVCPTQIRVPMLK